MDCKDTLKHLSDLLDGELEEKLEVQILEHIDKCWHCTEVKQNEAQLKAMIQEKLAYKRTTPNAVADSIRSITSK
ncbi:MAG: anti-sigma factor family protein [Bacteroidia bacterium]